MITPPSGTVTFLFTDIEGSTRSWENDPVAMRSAVERHDAIVRGARISDAQAIADIYAHHVLNGTGNSFYFFQLINLTGRVALHANSNDYRRFLES